jgi:hypothetical protein
MKTRQQFVSLILLTLLAALSLALAAMFAAAGAQEVLPRPEAPFQGKIGRTLKDSKPDFPKAVEAPKGAPNVLLILTDDVGFGASAPLAARSRLRTSSASPTPASGTPPWFDKTWRPGEIEEVK